MSNHTPGPWFVEDNDRAISSNAATDIALVNMANIRYGWDGPDFLTASHRAANAQLIAAAPELLEALKYCRNKIAFMQEFGEWYSPERAIEKADAAIAKATGDSV